MPHTPTTPELFYEMSGPEHGPRVLLVMGFGMRGQVWKPQIDGLSDSHRLAWFDARGIGQSQRSEGLWGMRELVDDALRVLDALKWRERVHLVGVSMGGMVVQHLVLAEPERFASLALVATTPGGSLRDKLPTPEGLFHFARANLASQETRRKVLLRLLYTPEFVRSADPAELEARMQAQMGVRAPRPTLWSQFRAVLSHDVTARLHELALPTLVIRPERDILIRPASSDRLARAIPGARLVSLPDGAHGALFQCADAVNRALAEHIANAS